MTLKILSIYPDAEVAMEGFIEDIVGFLTGSSTGLMGAKEANAVVEKIFADHNPIKNRPRVEKILQETVFNKKWLAKTLPKKTTEHKSDYAWLDGKPQPQVAKLIPVMSGPMFELAKMAIEKLEDNTKLRKALIEQVNNASSAEEADEIYLKNKKALNINAAEVYVQRGGKTGHSITSGENTKWPIVIHKGHKSFAEYLGGNKSPIEKLDANNAGVWGKAIVDLLDLQRRTWDLYRENQVEYWEDCKHDYDDLLEGDDIFEKIFTGQGTYQFSPMLGLYMAARDLAKELVRFILTK